MLLQCSSPLSRFINSHRWGEGDDCPKTPSMINAGEDTLKTDKPTCHA